MLVQLEIMTLGLNQESTTENEGRIIKTFNIYERKTIEISGRSGII